MPGPDKQETAVNARRLSDAELIDRAAKALNPQLLQAGFWVADVAAAVEGQDGRIYTGASIGGYLSMCAEMAALGQLVTATTPSITRVVAVWRDQASGVLHVLPPCGRCREFMRTLAQDNLNATVILGSDHTATLRALLPYPGWHAERINAQTPNR